MQPTRKLTNWMAQNASSTHYLFNTQDLRILLPDLSTSSFKTLLSRAVKNGTLIRCCRGLYAYPNAIPHDGLILYQIVAKLRGHEFNYLSLESVLSDAGVISQIPINWITVMSSGRSSTISCGNFGSIEFIHTNHTPDDIAHELIYDTRCHLWRANVPLALKDMKTSRRNDDLIDWEIANEFIRSDHN